MLLDDYEIGKIQTRRAPSRTEILTIAASGFVPGHNVDWLMAQADVLRASVVVRRLDSTRAMMTRRPSGLRRSAG